MLQGYLLIVKGDNTKPTHQGFIGISTNKSTGSSCFSDDLLNGDLDCRMQFYIMSRTFRHHLDIPKKKTITIIIIT